MLRVRNNLFWSRALLIVALSVPFSILSGREQLVGTVTGTVKVIKGQDILPKSDARLEFSSGNAEFDTRTNERGEYKISIPAGVQYRAVVVYGFGACAPSRAAFTPIADKSVVINFIGIDCPFVDTERMDVPLEPEANHTAYHSPCETSDYPPEPPVWYREEKIEPDVSKHRPEVMVSFGHCIENKQDITYFSLDPAMLQSSNNSTHSAAMPLQVAVTTGLYTIRADRVLFRRSDDVFHASGNVLIENGTMDSVRVDSVTLSFDKTSSPEILTGK